MASSRQPAMGAGMLLLAVLLLGTASANVSRRTLLQRPPPLVPKTAGTTTAAATPAAVTPAEPPAANAANVTESATSTIFAPTDAAFEELATALKLASPLDLFNATYNATAANITELHVVPGVALTAMNITAAGNVTATSLLGVPLLISASPNGTVTVTVPGSAVVARVIAADVPFNGSIVHVIDRVLVPPANETAGWEVPLP
ncbi:hypothetical protein HYH03_006854 [Edaphochlamys debaryana]|uniref:FAS1 domain-containing protein n=1 Tax=Edaphochlamys debaryana TaxID=47281 RepID=A0A836C0W8_9CHLO|nr:hypothetical protein HYH03_006854 [Edaphochlamys debaryana]|eukprot:KAG2494919.1 hypothetical protein HYH03_006854 [Edaphochlamys debaryana]